jgi:hypothetical protein
MSSPKVPLSDAIRAIKAEIQDALAKKVPSEPELELHEINLEFEVQVERSGESGVSVSLWVVDADASGSLKSSSTHKVSVRLAPAQPIFLGEGEDALPDAT